MNPITVPSSCIGVCAIDDATGYCKGCYRSIPEVASWLTMNDEEKTRTLELLPQRKPPEA